MVSSKLKLFLNLFLAVVILAFLAMVLFAILNILKKPIVKDNGGGGVTKPLNITIYCESDYCQPKEIMAGAGALIRTCYRDLSTCESTWKTFLDSKNKVEFKYPEKFGANVWRTFFWPPKEAVIPGGQDPLAKGCPDLLADTSIGQKPPLTNMSLNGRDFSLYTSNGAGAGSLYSTYCYVTKKDQDNVAIEFTIQSHTGCYQGGCGAYCGTPNEQECRNFDLQRDVASPINSMMATLKFD